MPKGSYLTMLAVCVVNVSLTKVIIIIILIWGERGTGYPVGVGMKHVQLQLLVDEKAMHIHAHTT